MAQAIDCKLTRECSSYLSDACATCKYNKKRNAPKNWYTRANDKDLRDVPKKGEAYVANINAQLPMARVYECPACGFIVFMGPKSTTVSPLTEAYCEECGLKVVYGHL